MLVEVLLLCITILVSLYWATRKPKNFPPGPFRIPIIGNLFQISREPHKVFMEWGKTYGNTFSIYFGSYPTVILNDFKSIKEGFHESALSSRPPLKPFLERNGGVPRGVIFTSGDHWQDQRRFILKNLRDFGFGKKSMEELILVEINELIETFKKEVNKPMTMSGQFNAAVLNGLWSIITGTRYSHDDPRLKGLISRLTTNIKRSNSTGIFMFFPLIYKFRRAFPWLFGEAAMNSKETLKRTTGFMKETIDEHKKTFDPDSSPRDFIDVYFREIYKTKDENSSFFGEEGENNLVIVLLDLFVAGAETTSTTLSWAFLLLSLHPEIQEKLFDEINSVVGVSKMPTLSDRPKMPYLEAVIAEVQRYAAMTPLGIFHYADEDFTYREYTIPKGTIVIGNLYNALRDPGVWGDADNFRPERFLSEDGLKFVKNEALIPFSTGKRVCLGETLARDELFLFMSSLFQRFRVGVDPNGPRPKIDYYPATVLIPKPHDLVLQDRHALMN